MPRRMYMVIAVILVGLTLTGIIYWFGLYKGPLDISIAFDRVDGVGEGNEVVLGDIAVGEVTGLRTTESGRALVDVRIDKNYADEINSSSVFIIDRDPLTSNKRIRVQVLKEDAPPLTQGARAEGYSSPAQFFMRTSKKILEGAYQEFVDWVREFKIGFEEFEEDERLKKLRKDVRELMEQARRSAEQGIAELNKEIPRLKEELNKIIEELRKLGKGKEGEELKDTFDRYLEGLEQKKREARIKNSPLFFTYKEYKV
ncbi:MAG TPA: MlaD family protein [Thermodesulfobacteriota bacterium]|nr:MlaD family protein [Thermodesulfobacteriota bacterium]